MSDVESNHQSHYSQHSHPNEHSRSYDELPVTMPSINSNGNTFKFGDKFQKSKYTASTTFPISSSQHSRPMSQQYVKKEEDQLSIGKYTSQPTPLDHSPASPPKKATRRLYEDTDETKYTMYSNHLSEKSHSCHHGHEFSAQTPSTSKHMGGEEDGSENRVEPELSSKKTVTCNCKKSKCLKLYCDCFAAGEVCGPECNCCNCHNDEGHNDERNTAMLAVLDRNPYAFRPKFDKQEAVVATEVEQLSLVCTHKS